MCRTLKTFNEPLVVKGDFNVADLNWEYVKHFQRVPYILPHTFPQTTGFEPLLSLPHTSPQTTGFELLLSLPHTSPQTTGFEPLLSLLQAKFSLRCSLTAEKTKVALAKRQSK